MLKSYLKIALRNFLKEKFYSMLNIIGLAVGIAVVLVISLFLYQELRYDVFHSKAARIYRLGTHLEFRETIADLNATFPAYAKALEEDLVEVESAVRVLPKHGQIFRRNDTMLSEDNVYFVDSNFFQLFDYKVLYGDPFNALNKHNTILLTPSTAAKLFSNISPEKIVGETVLMNNDLYEITGIVEDAPENSHMKFSSLASLPSVREGRTHDWDNLNLSCYVLLKEGHTIESLLSHHDDVMRTHVKSYDELEKEGIVMAPIAHKLTDIHLTSALQGEFREAGSITNIYIFGVVALVVLILASVNFVNLVTARSANRAKEVGVRKVMGSAASTLRRQFIVESILFVAIATILALGCVELLRGPFEVFSGLRLPFEVLITKEFTLAVVLFVALLGIAAGTYPAFYLASFRPAMVLKGKGSKGVGVAKLRNGLVILQFAVSMVLITCTLVVQKQLDFMRSVKLGFDKENVLIIDNADRLRNQQVFLNAVRALPEVKMAGVATHRPIDDYDGMLVTSQDDKENRKLVHFSRVDHDFLPLMEYELVAGRFFSRDFPSDSAAAVVNEKAAALLFNGDPIGKTLENDMHYTVIGVIKNFNFESLKNDIKPLVFYLQPNQRYVHVRLQPGDFSKAIARLEMEWKKTASEVPFSYSFLDQSYDNLYKQEIQLGMLFSVFTMLALLIACLGLIGLAAYTAQQRKKEISVRKVLGASVPMIVALLSKQFIKLVIISFLVALPIAWYLTREWLDSFAFKTEVPVYITVAGGVAVIIVAFASVFYQSIRAGFTNPVESLKEE